MIPKPDDHSWKKEFARSAAYRAEQIRFSREADRQRKETLRVDKTDDDLSDLAISVTLASDSQVLRLQTKLSDYRTATVESLMENERQLVEVRRRLDDMLSKAYVLPDGRRVFKTEDGLRVFDEHGVELGTDDINPDEIEDWRPRANGYLKDLKVEHALIEDREERLELLERIDAAEARIEAGDLTVEDIADIERELDAFAPIDIANRVSGIDRDDIVPINRHFGAAARDPTTDLRPPALTSPAPGIAG